MKKLLFIVIISIFGCTDPEDKKELRINPPFNMGTIVYLKPESTKAVIVTNRYNKQYYVVYSDSMQERHKIRVYEAEIFGK